MRAASIVCYFCESADGTQGIFCGTLRKTFDPVSLYLIAVDELNSIANNPSRDTPLPCAHRLLHRQLSVDQPA